MAQATQWQVNDDLLNFDINDLSDLPMQNELPDGTYQFLWTDLTAATREKDVDGEKVIQVRVELELAYQGAVELKNFEEASELEGLEVGKAFKYGYFLGSQPGKVNWSEGFMKEALKELCAQTGVTNVQQLKGVMSGATVNVSLTRSKRKDDETKFNANIKQIVKV